MGSDTKTTLLPREPGVVPESGDGSGNGEGSICCPLCKWKPGKHDRWICKCSHIWNTFDTGGVCPKCLYQWRVTQCRVCLGISAHSDWYPKS